MLKIVYQICCGLDVHRDFVYACIATTENGITTYKSHRFSTFTRGLRELLSWLLQNRCRDVCMESTGKYWIPIYNILESNCKIVLAHPKYVKAIRGKKTDKKDAKWIADIFKHDLVSGSFIPPAVPAQQRRLVEQRQGQAEQQRAASQQAPAGGPGREQHAAQPECRQQGGEQAWREVLDAEVYRERV